MKANLTARTLHFCPSTFSISSLVSVTLNNSDVTRIARLPVAESLCWVEERVDVDDCSNDNQRRQSSGPRRTDKSRIANDGTIADKAMLRSRTGAVLRWLMEVRNKRAGLSSSCSSGGRYGISALKQPPRGQISSSENQRWTGKWHWRSTSGCIDSRRFDCDV